jgi:hypothetical protein
MRSGFRSSILLADIIVLIAVAVVGGLFNGSSKETPSEL